MGKGGSGGNGGGRGGGVGGRGGVGIGRGMVVGSDRGLSSLSRNGDVQGKKSYDALRAAVGRGNIQGGVRPFNVLKRVGAESLEQQVSASSSKKKKKEEIAV